MTMPGQFSVTINRQSAHIDGIIEFRSFCNISVELPFVRGFYDAFWFDFRDVAVRDADLVDAAHHAIGAQIVVELDGGPDGEFVLDVEM